MNFIADYYDYELYDNHGHILVFRPDGSFAFSADTIKEAKQDIWTDIFMSDKEME